MRVHVPVIASGGADTAEHIREAFKAGADAVLAASIFHDGDTHPGRRQALPAGARDQGPAVIVPSIDLQGGQTVQLVGGAEKAIDAGDPGADRRALRARRRDRGDRSRRRHAQGQQRRADRGPAAALRLPGRRRHPRRRDRDRAGSTWVPRKVILGTAAKPEILSRLPRERVIAALDARARRGRGRGLAGGHRPRHPGADRRAEGACRRLPGHLRRARGPHGRHRPRARQGRGRGGGRGLPGDHRRRRHHGRGDPGAGRARRRRPGRHGALHRPARPRRRDHGAAGHRPAGRALSDRRGRRARRVPGAGLLVQGIDPRGRPSADGHLPVPLAAACGSRARPAAPPRSCCASTSTATATARASSSASTGPGFCHLDTRTCWGEDAGLGRLARTLAERREQAPAGSYTAKLFADPALLGAKLREEADELAEAATRDEVIWEAADVLYFTLARLAARGHRPGRGRGASRPAGAQGDAARMSLTVGAGATRLAPCSSGACSSRCS